MATVQAPKNHTSEIEIFARLIKADQSDLSRELARYILKLGFEEKDQNRMRELAERNKHTDLRGARGASRTTSRLGTSSRYYTPRRGGR